MNGASIGSGEDANCGGTISITGGNVTATSTNSGAGIGAGDCSNMTGTIEITGGTVFATSKKFGAGIGAGYEDAFGFGGECEGTVRITGGTVTAVSSKDAVAIGHGADGSDNGKLQLGDNMKAKATSNTNGSGLGEWGKNDRSKACRQVYCRIEPCYHTSKTYTLRDDPTAGHVWHCAYCAVTGSEAHTLDQNNTCSTCGYHDGRTWTVTLLSNNGTAETSSDEIPFGKTYVIPKCAFSASEGMRFAGWQKVENGQGVGGVLDAGTVISGDEDKEYQAIWDTAYTITVNNPSENDPGSVKTVPANSEFSGKTVKVEPASLKPGYLLSGVTVTDAGGNAVAVTDNSSFVMPASNVTVTPSFTHTHKYSVKNWTWSGDETEGLSASLILKCDYCGEETEPLAATVTGVEGKSGSYVASVEYGGPTYTDFYTASISWGTLQEMILEENEIVLTHDVTASAADSALTVPDGRFVYIDLNGHTIDRNLSEPTAGGSVFMVYGNLVITDSAGGGTITGGNTTEQGGGVYISRNGFFALRGGGRFARRLFL